MKDENKTKEHLIDELVELRQQLAELKASESEHRRAEEALQGSKEFIETVMNSLTDSICTIDTHDFKVTGTDRAFLKMLKMGEKEVIGKTCYELTHRLSEPCGPPDHICPLSDTVKTGQPSSAEHVHWDRDGNKIYVETSTHPMTNEKGEVYQVVHLARDITERKRAEEALQNARDDLERRVDERAAELVIANVQLRSEIEERKRAEEALRRVNRALKTLSNCNQALVHAVDESELIAEICRIIVEIGGYRLAWVGFAEQDQKKTVRPVGQWGYEEGYLATVNITWAETERGRGPTGTAIRNCKPSVVRHIQTDPDYEPWRAEATKRGYASSIALPLLAAEKSFGALNIYAAEPDAFDTEEVFFLDELAQNLSYGIMMLRLRAERKRADEELRKSETKYSILVESSLTGIYIEQSGKIAFANDKFAKICGYSKDELTGIEAWRLIHPKDRPLINEITAKRLRGEKAPSEYEARGLTKDGKTIWVTRRNTLIEYKGSSAVLGNIVDISKRKRMEKALRESGKELRLLSSQLLTAQENERERIARELHDGIGQSLSAIKFSVESILRQMDKSMTEGSVGSLKTLIPLIQEAIEEVRKIAMDLRPSTLDDLGILATISWFCREFQTIYSGIRIEKQITIQENEVPDPLKTIIYRVLQEALNNVAKHSEADLVRLSLGKRDSTIELAIEDNGLGFDLEDVFSGESLMRGLGLASMRERTEVSGGAFAIESVKGTGTIVRATWKQ